MRMATIISLGASAVLGLGALVAAKFLLPDATKEKVVQTAPVVVAAKPITFGTRLDEKNLAVVQLPVEAAPVGSYRTVKEVIALDGGAPVALTALVAREPVLPAKLSGGGARASLAAMITPGMRAYTVKFSDVSGGGGHVLPGDRVDVLLTHKLNGDDETASESEVVLQNVRILGINMNADQTTTEKATPKHVTLEVTVEDAERLSIASQVGSLSLALRRTGSAEVDPIRAIKVRDLRLYGPPLAYRRPAQAAVSDLPPAPPAAPSTPAPRKGGLVIINGTQRTTANAGAGA